MQPGTEPPGSRRARDDETADTGAVDTRAGVARPVRRARIGLLLLLAFMTEIIVIAAAGNQAVTDNLVNAGPHTIKGGFEESLETYAWRVSPRSHDVFHIWAGSLALIGATVVLSLLLIFVMVRGPLTFARAFFGAWLSVIVATMLGAYVRGLVIDTPARSTHGIPARALFSSLAPGSTTFLAGVALGLVVALVVAFFGIATRRADEVAGPDGYADEPYDAERAGYGAGGYGTGGGYGDPGYGAGGYGAGGYGAGGYGAGGYGATPAESPYGTRSPEREQPRGYGGGADEPTRAVPWQDAPSDSSETTALPTMRPREHGAQTTDPVSAADERTQAVPAQTEPSRGASAETEPTQAVPAQAEPSHGATAPTAPTLGVPAQAQPTQAVPAQAEPSHGATAPTDPTLGVPAQAQPTQAVPAQAPDEAPNDAGDAQQGDAHQTTQFPRPPDDEDFDPEHS